MSQLTQSHRGFSLFAVVALSAAACIANGDGSDDTSRRQDLLSDPCSGMASWGANQSYKAGDQVQYNGNVYRCLQPHTAVSNWYPDQVPALWSFVMACAPGGGVTVAATTTTAAGGNGCTGGAGGGTTSSTSTTSGGGNCNFPTWMPGTHYNANDIVYYAMNGHDYQAKYENPGYDPTVSTWYWAPYSGPCNGGGSTTSSTTSSTGAGMGNGGDGFGGVLPESVFNQMFPSRNQFYSYQAMVAGAAAFPGLGTTGDPDTRKREVAAFLANVAHETLGLVYIEEIVKGDYQDNSWGGADCNFIPGHQYYGRGPLQISWNGNYCAAGKAIGADLLHNPELVAQDAGISWKTGFWFWMTATGAGSHTSHDAIVQGLGFGETIRSINGGLECNGKNTAEMQDRINFYNTFTTLLGVSPGPNEGC
jgi:predicted chitinase